MKPYVRKPLIVHAVQITEETFSRPHPNPDHVPGVMYNPITKTAEVFTGGGQRTLDIGDWIVDFAPGDRRVFTDDAFRRNYDPR